MLSKSTKYAIRALVYIQLKNWEGKRPGMTEIALEIDSPQAFTAKILQNLVKHDLLNSMKGRGGGFFFNEYHEKVSLYDIVIIMEGKGLFEKCGIGLKDCSDNNPCPLHFSYVKTRDGFRDILKKESIQSLARKVKSGKAVITRVNEILT